jgi:hypothetical protein
MKYLPKGIEVVDLRVRSQKSKENDHSEGVEE